MARIGIDTRLTYYRTGGIAAYMEQLLNAMAQLNPPETILSLANFRSREKISPFEQVKLYTPAHHRFEAWALGAELARLRLDLLHSPDFIPPRWGAKRYVITVHDLAFLLYSEIQTAASLRYYAGGIRRAVAQADQIIAVSAATQADLIRLLNVPQEKISVIWEGISPDFHPMTAPDEQKTLAATLQRYQLIQDDYLLFLGTIEPRKNLPNLLRAYANLKADYPDAPPLVLVGQEGWLAEETFQTMQALNLGDAIRWLGKVPYADLRSLYNGARLHVLVSLYEGFGFTPLEAMACGKPNVVSGRGALQEVCGDCAVYVDPDDPASIAEGLARLLNDSALYADLQKRGLDHVRQFTWANAAAQTLALYRNLL